ncbi:MAG: glycosyltransferase [Aggregatilineales bacterium]
MSVNRIAIICVHTSPLAPLGGKKTGGMNVYVRELARQFGEAGIGVDIFTRRSSPELPEIDLSLGMNVRVIHVNCGPKVHLNPDDVYPHLSQFAAGVIAFTTKYHVTYDILYSHYWLSGWVANKLKEVWNTPFVHMFHTLGHMKNRISSTQPRLPDVRVRVETQIVEWADRIIAATPAEQAQLLWLYRADRRKIDIVPPGVDAEHFHPIPQQEAKAKLGIDDATRLFLFVGRIEPLKAVDMIIEAVDIIWSERPELIEKCRLAIIGGDPEDPTDEELNRLQRITHTRDLNRYVEFLGAKGHPMLPYYYSAAEAVVVPSDYESFGMVALEAMASGTPVIASEVGGLAFLVQDSKTGYLIPVRDPKALAGRLIKLLESPQERQMLGENATKLAQHYQWSKIKDRLMMVFEELTDRRSRKPAVV